MTTINPICNYDFTLSQKICPDYEDVRTFLRGWAKKWVFQLEEGDSGYMHWQGRFSLIKKRRLQELVEAIKGSCMQGAHLSPTSAEGSKSFCYVMKVDTRISGPWADTDEVIYIPRQYRDKVLWPFQRQIVESACIFEPRKNNLIIAPTGGEGKSTVAAICELLYGGIDMPPLNDFKELIALACDICMDKNIRTPRIMFFDLPRAVRKDALYGLYSAIEQIKKGKLYDCRYHYKSWWIDSPQTWVFSNNEPDYDMLSLDRWVIWRITENAELELVRGSPGANAVTLEPRINSNLSSLEQLEQEEEEEEEVEKPRPQYRWVRKIVEK